MHLSQIAQITLINTQIKILICGICAICEKCILRVIH
jgi:hypothetical protein